MSPDPVKDQTYFLAYLTQNQLSRAIFPIGEFKKSEVRKFAHQFLLPTMDRRDSQGICFLGQIKFDEFIKHHLGEIRGDIVDMDTGKKLGRHNGYYYYTIGQRSGLGLSGGPWYVVKKDVKENIVFISKENLYKREKNTFSVGKFNWILEEKPSVNNLKVKIRHGAKMYNCILDFKDENEAEVKLDKPDQGIAPGQFAVFYQDNLCLGSGVIL
jgi:tRNA-specific 2-thiouridylase